jgi:REP element-mobilizing transposase RayT
MAKTEHYFTQFESNAFYHVYNRTVDKSKLFANHGNYMYFLKKLDEYLTDYVEIYAYCLLGNHFHLMIRVLPEKTIKENLLKYQEVNPERILSSSKSQISEKSVSAIVSHQFKKFFQAYAMAFNKQQNRIGTLFQTPFKRALVEKTEYFKSLVYYIHANPKLHGITQDFTAYEWSSYRRILLETNTKLKKTELLEWFGGINGFLEYHEDENDFNHEKGIED